MLLVSSDPLISSIRYTARKPTLELHQETLETFFLLDILDPVSSMFISFTQFSIPLSLVDSQKKIEKNSSQKIKLYFFLPYMDYSSKKTYFIVK
jgi:hypothetical protein